MTRVTQNINYKKYFAFSTKLFHNNKLSIIQIMWKSIKEILNATCAQKHVITFFLSLEVNDAKEIMASYAWKKYLISSELSIESLLAAVSNSLNINPSGVVYHSCLQHESFLTVSHLLFKHTWHRRRNISHIPQVSIIFRFVF